MKFLIGIILSLVVLSGSSIAYSQDDLIPSWIKGIAEFWGEGKITDSEFIDALEFLIESDMIKVNNTRILELENENMDLRQKIESLESEAIQPEAIEEVTEEELEVIEEELEVIREPKVIEEEPKVIEEVMGSRIIKVFVQTDSTHYDEGDIITISGNSLPKSYMTSLTLTIISPIGNIIPVGEIAIQTDGSYSAEYDTGNWNFDTVSGEYTIQVKQHSFESESRFNYTTKTTPIEPALENIPTSDSLESRLNYTKTTIDSALENIPTSDIVFTNKYIDYQYGGTNVWPKYTMTYPSTAKVGVPFDVIYDYSYVIPDEETGSYEDPEDWCPVETCQRHTFEIFTRSYVDILNEGAEFITSGSDVLHLPVRNSTVYGMDAPFDNTMPLQQTFTFVINEPDIDYRIGVIDISIHSSTDERNYFYVDKKGNIFFDPMMEYNFTQSRFAGTSIASELETELNKLQEKPIEYVHVPSEASLGLREGVPPALYQDMADKLLIEYPGANYEELLQSANFTQSWINKFLNAMPQLKQ